MSSRLSTKKMNAALQSAVDEPPFPLFAELPCELRLLCWRAALPGPRIIKISCVYSRGDGPFQIQPIASYKAPVLLSINKESCEVAQAAYEQLYSVNLRRNPVYMDLSKDTLVFFNQSCMAGFFDLDFYSNEGLGAVPLELTRAPKVIGIASTIMSRRICLIKGTAKAMQKLGNPEWIVLLRKSGPVGYRQASVAKHIADTWNPVTQHPNLPYKGPPVEACTFKQLQMKLDILDNPDLVPKPTTKTHVVRKPRVPKSKGVVMSTRRSVRLPKSNLIDFELGLGGVGNRESVEN